MNVTRHEHRYSASTLNEARAREPGVQLSAEHTSLISARVAYRDGAEAWRQSAAAEAMLLQQHCAYCCSCGMQIWLQSCNKGNASDPKRALEPLLMLPSKSNRSKVKGLIIDQ